MDLMLDVLLDVLLEVPLTGGKRRGKLLWLFGELPCSVFRFTPCESKGTKDDNGNGCLVFGFCFSVIFFPGFFVVVALGFVGCMPGMLVPPVGAAMLTLVLGNPGSIILRCVCN